MRKKMLWGIGVLAFVPLMVRATPILFTDGSIVYQQTLNSPCVIGNPSCSQGGFVHNSWASTPGGGQGSTYDLFSPVYIVGADIAVPNTIPSEFSIGIDVNFSAGSGDESLVFFKTWVCSDAIGTSCSVDSANSYPGPTTAIGQRNGNGYSDAVLSGFTLTPGTYVKFEASVSNDTDGMEQFFLVPAGVVPPSEVPEPATTALIGGGLLSLAWVIRRRQRRV